MTGDEDSVIFPRNQLKQISTVVPVSFGTVEESGKLFEVCGKQFLVHGSSDRDIILASLLNKYPNLIIVDYTVPTTVNDNAELYCRAGVPFVMGTTGGDREKLYNTVKDSNVYADISPQMGKQVTESLQASKADVSGTAKAVISCFEKLGVSFDMDQIKLIRDPRQQAEMLSVPEEHLPGHAYHTYRLTSPDETVSFEFQHNVCGRSIYAEGTVDAIIFLSKKVRSKAEKRIHDMIDVLREGSMR